MLSELRITDLGVINEATLDLDAGLTVVTGETGAGKTMIVSSIGLLLGGKTDAGVVRNGADRARVEGVFRIADDALAEQVTEAGGSIEDGDLLVARHITAAGRSRAYLGGAQVTAALCGELTGELVAVHGQSEQVRLSRADRQREILDRFAGPKLAKLLTSYGADYAEHRRATAELQELRSNAQQRAREIDLLRFGLDEISAVDPQPGEDDALASEATRLQAADDLRLTATSAMVAIAGDDDDPTGAAGALSALGVARKAAEQLAGLDADARELSGRVNEVDFLLSDVAADLSRYLDGLEVEPGRLEQIAARRSELAGLTRKYGDTVDQVLAWGADAARQLSELETGDDRIEDLTAEIATLDARLTDQAGRISKQRRAAAKKLATAVLTELSALAMPHARLEFAVQPADRGPYGADQVDLLFSANPGTEPRPLARTASGGELSRVRLALEVVLAGQDARGGADTSAFVFDEVDAGVGGKVAVEIGRRLATLAEHAQVIVVTHLAQVAAFADRHYVVAKASDGQVTTSGVTHVVDGQRSAELARMMAGLDETETSIAHAEELLALAASHRAG
ncbi:DNA repair protein RecN [Microlunatus soli]|uniref:DNA repair protein RecN n=1 Tax=Microlunatus soli TaxID=630515 RepID=A0A1H1XYV8_9ACTN|nr:DNA repair protein RecN [Microlunatus soli]SDT14382.1 DNA replication and repair protein RecN [Microlunatus soli]